MTPTRADHAATVERDDHLRLFCALTLSADTRARIAAWQRSSLACSADEGRADECNRRPVEREQLHITLAFLGRLPRSNVAAIATALEGAARQSAPILLSPLRYRETRSVSMLVLVDEHGRAGQLAIDLHERLERLGVYTREARAWLPHVTVLRFRSRPRLRPPAPTVPPFSPSGAAVYHSVLAPGGARYEVLESVPLGSSAMFVCNGRLKRGG